MSLFSAVLALEDGSVFYGTSIGVEGNSTGEVVFNTGMTGYQEILTDPSYARQIVTLTYPHIGNTGCNAEDFESSRAWAAGLVIRDLPLLASNFRSEQSLQQFLAEQNVVAIAEIDTRRLTRILRDKGAQGGCIVANAQGVGEQDATRALEQARAFPGLAGMDLAQEVTCNAKYEWRESTWALGKGYSQVDAGDLPLHVVCYDFGVKRNILRMLVDRGCRVSVVPAQTPASEVLALNPDGVMLSNGPGDPEPCSYAIESIQALLDAEVPTFGICLGHQLLALACGAKTLKMKFGHHGCNHPVQNLYDKTVMITSQNHGFAADEATLPAHLGLTHKSLFDKSVQGIEHRDKPAFGFQGHPEASPGPHDVGKLFDRFVDLMEGAPAPARAGEG